MLLVQFFAFLERPARHVLECGVIKRLVIGQLIKQFRVVRVFLDVLGAGQFRLPVERYDTRFLLAEKPATIIRCVPVAGVPVAGVPVAGVPVAGVPVAGVPVAGVPVAGVPVAGVPVAGVPVAGVPVAGVPVAGVPVAGVPVAGVPVAGVPVAGVPVAGVPVAGVPVAGGMQFFCQPNFTTHDFQVCTGRVFLVSVLCLDLKYSRAGIVVIRPRAAGMNTEVESAVAKFHVTFVFVPLTKFILETLALHVLVGCLVTCHVVIMFHFPALLVLRHAVLNLIRSRQ